MNMLGLEQGDLIRFRSEHYLGLGTRKKDEFSEGWVRKIDHNGFYIVYFSPMNGNRIFACFPWDNDEWEVVKTAGKIKEESKHLLDIDVTENDSFFIWNEYQDKEAMKQIYENQKAKMEKL